MLEVQELLEAFIAEDRGPSAADPLPYLARVDGLAREELELLIDAYLARAPRRAVDPAALRGPEAHGLAPGAWALAERVERSYLGAAGEWPILLPRLREQARLPRRTLVTALAQRLGVEDETDRVADYYHQMEQGLLPAAGVSDRVLSALGVLLGQGAERLRAAGRAIAPPAANRTTDTTGAAFARTATPDEELVPTDDVLQDIKPEARSSGFVDELFTGGPDGGAAP
jgi:hypothetical protein